MAEDTTANGVDWEELKRQYEKNAPPVQQHVCPNCGYCPHCGRGGYVPAPYYPSPWYPRPWYLAPYFWMTSNGTSGSVTVSEYAQRGQNM